MARWLGGGGIKEGALLGGENLGSSQGGKKEFLRQKRKEKWLVTRKTWRYMADAGKLLIPEVLRKGKDYKEYTDDDFQKLEEHYQNVCEQQREFIIWEGPLQDPFIFCSKNEFVPASEHRHFLSQPSTNFSQQNESINFLGQDTDYRLESNTAKFRMVLPSGQNPPPGYIQVGTRHLPVGDYPNYQFPESYVQLPSGLLLQQLPQGLFADTDYLESKSGLTFPLESGMISPIGRNYNLPLMDSYTDEFYHITNRTAQKSRCGYGVDSVAIPQKKNATIQTDPLPEEFFYISDEILDKGYEEFIEIKYRDTQQVLKTDEVVGYTESEKDGIISSIEECAALLMEDTIMKHLKILQKNSKSPNFQIFENMNSDPMLPSIKSKYVPLEQESKNVHVQCTESILNILKLCETPIGDPKERKYSQTSDLSDYIGLPNTPPYSIIMADETIVTDTEENFFSYLYRGKSTNIDQNFIPEEYYSYLQSWYQARKSLLTEKQKSWLTPPLFYTNMLTSFASKCAAKTGSMFKTSSTYKGLFIPVSALESLRATLPAHLPQPSSGSIGCFSTTPTSVLCISQSITNMKIPSSGIYIQSNTSNSLGFFSSVKAKSRSASTCHGKIAGKKLWQTRSKSQGHSNSVPAWKSKGKNEWVHESGQRVVFTKSSLLVLHDIERIHLQKLAQVQLANSDLGTVIRIPKDTSDRGDISKTRRRANLLKRKVLSASSMVSKTANEKEGKTKSEGVVFGIPITQCVEQTRKISVIDILNEEMGSLNQCRYESLNDLRRLSLMDGSQMVSESLSQFASYDRMALAIDCDPMAFLNTQLCVPAAVITCIRYLELNGLNTVGIFRVSSSKKRVKQLRTEFDSGQEVILTDEFSVHDVATLLKEFFRDLPEPLIPREVYHSLLAIQKIRVRKNQLTAMQHVIQLLPKANRDTLYVLLNFLHLVAEHSKDCQSLSGEEIIGNKMDSMNIATLFAPNILHSMKNESNSISPENDKKAIEMVETINIVRFLIDHNKELFELPSEDLDQLYHKLSEDIPDSLDYLLHRRVLLNGDELIEDFDTSLFFDLLEPQIGYGEKNENYSCNERSLSNDSINTQCSSSGITTGSLGINMTCLQAQVQHDEEEVLSGEYGGKMIISPGSVYSTNKVILKRLSQENESKYFKSKIKLPYIKTIDLASEDYDLNCSESGTPLEFILRSPPKRKDFKETLSNIPSTKQTTKIHPTINVEVKTQVTNNTDCAQHVSLDVKPVPVSKLLEFPIESLKTLTRGSVSNTSFSIKKINKKDISFGLSTISFSHTICKSNGKLQRAFMESEKSKPENLDYIILGNEKELASVALDEGLSQSFSTREVKKYKQRRYTDSRHPTKELPDLRTEISHSEESKKIISICNPYYRKTQSNQSLGQRSIIFLSQCNIGENKITECLCNSIKDRPSYKRWHNRPLFTSKSNLSTYAKY